MFKQGGSSSRQIAASFNKSYDKMWDCFYLNTRKRFFVEVFMKPIERPCAPF